jgi:hypothetical protein
VISPSQTFRLMTELVFTLAGAVLLFVGLTGRYLFDPRSLSWLLLAAVLLFWGLRSSRRSRLIAVARLRFAERLSGTSLMLVGAIMLSLGWMKFALVGPLLALAGVIFVTRGLVVAVIVAVAA